MVSSIINGDRSDNVLIGTIGGDLIRGRGGDDFIDGGASADILVGGRGADTFFFEAGDGIDLFSGNVERDVIRRYETGVDTIQLDVAEEDVTFRDVSRGTIIEYEGGEILVRGASSSELTIEFADSTQAPAPEPAPGPAPGPNIPIGGNVIQVERGAGLDATATPDVDVFVVSDIDDVPVAATTASTTTIQGFASGDSRSPDDFVDVSAIDANSNTAGDDAFTFIRDAEFSGTAGELRAVFTPVDESTVNFVVGNVLIQGDVDGDGVADLQLRLQDDFTSFFTLDAPLGSEDFFL